MADDKLIYVATEGEYSDYHILGVFESAAEAARHGEVETYTLNQCPAAVIQKCWVVTVKNQIYWQKHKRDADNVKDFYISNAIESWHVVPRNTRGLLLSGCAYSKHLRSSTEVASFVSPEHAHKLAVELIQDCLRQYHLTPWNEQRTRWEPNSNEEETDG